MTSARPEWSAADLHLVTQSSRLFSRQDVYRVFMFAIARLAAGNEAEQPDPVPVLVVQGQLVAPNGTVHCRIGLLGGAVPVHDFQRGEAFPRRAPGAQIRLADRGGCRLVGSPTCGRQPRTWCGIVAGMTSDSSTKPQYSPFSNQGDW